MTLDQTLSRSTLAGTQAPLCTGSWSDGELTILRGNEAFAYACLDNARHARLQLSFNAEASSDDATRAILLGLEACFAAHEEIQEINLTLPEGFVSPRDLPFLAVSNNEHWAHRSGFYQNPDLWIFHKTSGRLRTGLVEGPNGRDFPLRPPHPSGLCYERYDPVADVVVSFRAVDIDRDLDTFHRWMNDGRVAYFWELAQSKDELRAYLEVLQSKPHTYPLIGCFNGEDAGYFETYWAREDRLGAYYASQAYDRGWHGLIGERKHLGKVKTGAWLRGLTHYLFLDCPLSENIMGEPRVDNAKLLSYADSLAYEKLKEFDFPHKRSALMCCRRDSFFSKVRL
ncbi:N(6)-hydroxylysine O-acetyltransferase [Pseudovibrio axinellae]|uniref:N(6)-hydroxylysine O-acetyltransferase n=1 Tax=Pseudovibrio axinellae TaxID=989403 RepID=A0A161V427_9HYPH|nr:GNAT family N-acetyltransferase [Pseudovibrio axinellae]KZL12662.1 N(6)-hydroxylysine O-acetyltransferase [Pseudovibrio axinellae]SEP62489.1 acetyl CoA:N6-hydroxylysine acetyl transferase [Pseudovibrio axinellae]